jgi:hypothetical protein
LLGEDLLIPPLVRLNELRRRLGFIAAVADGDRDDVLERRREPRSAGGPSEPHAIHPFVSRGRGRGSAGSSGSVGGGICAATCHAGIPTHDQ